MLRAFFFRLVFGSRLNIPQHDSHIVPRFTLHLLKKQALGLFRSEVRNPLQLFNLLIPQLRNIFFCLSYFF